MDFTEYLQHGHGISDSIEIAALTGDTRYIVRYYESGGDITVIDQRQQTLLHLATRNKAFLGVATIATFVKSGFRFAALNNRPASYTCKIHQQLGCLNCPSHPI